jgi:hypothetical protein
VGRCQEFDFRVKGGFMYGCMLVEVPGVGGIPSDMSLGSLSPFKRGIAFVTYYLRYTISGLVSGKCIHYNIIGTCPSLVEA